MKLVLYNIKNFLKQHTGFFILMIITIFFSSVIMLFSYGLFQNYKMSKLEFTASQMEFSIDSNTDIPDAIPMTKGEVIQCIKSLDENSFKDLKLIFTISQVDDCKVPFEEAPVTMEILSRFIYIDGSFRCYAQMFETLKNQGWFHKGIYYNDAQYDSGQPLMLLNEELAGDNLEFSMQGRTFKATAIIKGEPDVIYTSLNDDTKCSTIAFCYTRPPSLTQYNDICNTFKSVFGDRIKDPDIEPFYQEDYWLYNTIMMAAILIAIVASINLIILYQYILIKRRKALSIFMICGCTKNKAVIYYLAESLLITIPCFILSTLLYHNVLLGLFAKKFVFIESAYSMKLYMIAFAIYIAISAIAMLIVSNIMVRRSTITQLKAGDVS